MDIIHISDKDNVVVALADLKAGFEVRFDTCAFSLNKDVARGHKVAFCDIKQGENIIKYGYPIGHAICDIKQGDLVNTDNVKTNLDGVLNYTYTPAFVSPLNTDKYAHKSFKGYKRENGAVGTRNEVWIIPTVFCINTVAKELGRIGHDLAKDFANVDTCIAFPHEFGCSQMGKDHLNTQKSLAGLINNPNAGAVLVVGLGCENNNIEEFKEVLGAYNHERVKFLNCQDVEGDEVNHGVEILKELLVFANKYKRETCPISDLRLGLKCGSSDGLSGITANPLVGTVTDKIVAMGGTAVMTEVPEMFGAEQILMNRAKDKETFESIVNLINDFKNYYISHGEIISDNPSPGNKKGGISTLEEKSLGCIQKGGFSKVSGVLDYTDHVKVQGLNLLQSPGSDGISTTALAISGCNLIVYTTGRGTPFGTAVPGIKVSSNSNLATKKPNWIDFNAGPLVDGKDKNALSDELLDFILEVASGKATCDEIHGFKEINIWKDGVFL